MECGYVRMCVCVFDDYVVDVVDCVYGVDGGLVRQLLHGGGA